jgi:hypothetical protein
MTKKVWIIERNRVFTLGNCFLPVILARSIHDARGSSDRRTVKAPTLDAGVHSDNTMLSMRQFSNNDICVENGQLRVMDNI